MPDTLLALPDAMRDAVCALQARIAAQLPAADPLGRLAGRPLAITPVDAQTVAVVFREVPQVSETEVRAMRRVIDLPLFCTVTPESERTITVSFICRLG